MSWSYDVNVIYLYQNKNMDKISSICLGSPAAFHYYSQRRRGRGRVARKTTGPSRVDDVVYLKALLDRSGADLPAVVECGRRAASGKRHTVPVQLHAAALLPAGCRSVPTSQFIDPPRTERPDCIVSDPRRSGPSDREVPQARLCGLDAGYVQWMHFRQHARTGYFPVPVHPRSTIITTLRTRR
jgi:hypothetical protein